MDVNHGDGPTSHSPPWNPARRCERDVACTARKQDGHLWDLHNQQGIPGVAVACTARKQDGKRGSDLRNHYSYEELRSSVSNTEGLTILGAPSDVGKWGGHVMGEEGTKLTWIDGKNYATCRRRTRDATPWCCHQEHRRRAQKRGSLRALRRRHLPRQGGETHWGARKKGE